MTQRFILGIDPGLGGALVLYHHPDPGAAQHPPIIHDMPLAKDGKVDPSTLAHLVHQLHTQALNGSGLDCQFEAVIENVNSRPRQAGAFAFGLSTGILHGVLASHGIPFHLVTPAVWKGAMGLRRWPEETVNQNKDRARALASQLFPYAASQFKRVRDDGRAEALLLALFWANREKK